ncbi:putative tripeptidyl-peptidase SED2 [Grifola frondosa]|uniref:Putative tripeptidyl-peptidase SED2 n=1 Tax=Grifola frondosa TaxID=5627 RepID=A0A1C7MA47_GRIFR|nr:putative tripeptidyl-peptidase SED2 [Grifola frondosa]
MLWSSVLILTGLVQFCASKPLVSKRWDDFELKHAWDEIPRGWELHGPAPSDYRFDLRIGLRQDKFDDLVKALFEVSDPTHEKYGQHLSKAEVGSPCRASPDSVELVESWLLAHGLDAASSQRSPGGDWITNSLTLLIFRHSLLGLGRCCVTWCRGQSGHSVHRRHLLPDSQYFYSTGGSPPFIPDGNTPTNTNEPYLDWLNFILVRTLFRRLYGDDEPTVSTHTILPVPDSEAVTGALDYATSVCNLFAQLGDGAAASCSAAAMMASVRQLYQLRRPYLVPPQFSGLLSFLRRRLFQLLCSAQLPKFRRIDVPDQAREHERWAVQHDRQAYPDVSAQGEGFQVVIGGRVESVAGTSASSPTFAAVISLLNDFRLSQGKTPLGFLNPILYTTGVAGSTTSPRLQPGCGTNGFTAGTGWIRSLGWGRLTSEAAGPHWMILGGHYRE